MRSQEEILSKVPFRKTMYPGIYMTRMKIGKTEGSIIWSPNEDGWEHVSFSPSNYSKMPSWEEMCELKDLFWDDEEEVIQIHPKKSEYVNIRENCLHLWRHPETQLPS